MWLTIWREHIDSVIKNTYMKSLIVTRKPKRSLEYSHKAIDTLSPAKRIQISTTDEIVEITPSDELSQSPELIQTPSPVVEYNASPSWVIPNTQDLTHSNIPKSVIESLVNDPFTYEKCELDGSENGQSCIIHGANYNRLDCNLNK